MVALKSAAVVKFKSTTNGSPPEHAGQNYGIVSFKVFDDTWFSSDSFETLGMQSPVSNVFRQGFVFKEGGNYLIRAEFESDGEPYVIDFPLRIGDPMSVGPLGLTVLVIFVILLVVNISQRRKLQRLKAGRHHAEVD